MIETRNLGVSRDRWILKDVNFSASQGERIGLIGKSGAGKSSFLKALSGHIDVHEGEVSLDGKRIIGPSLKLIPGYRQIQLVDQEFRLDPYHTVEENIREVALHLEKTERDELVDELLELVALKHIKNSKAHLISGGEKQRLAIVRSLALRPDYLLLDEPFVHLDAQMKNHMLAYIERECAQNEMTVIIASHNGEELLGFVDRIVSIDAGRIARDASSNDFYYHAHSKEEATLLGAINLVHIDGKEILFRPNQYELAPNGKLSLSLVESRNHGMYFMHHYRTKMNESIQLIALKHLGKEIGINVIDGEN